MTESNASNVAASIVDIEAADRAADRIVLAYELADMLADYADEDVELHAAALSTAQIVVIFGILQFGMPEKVAVAEFARGFRMVRKHMKKLGKDVRLRDVLTEMSLDHRRERKR